ncbi:putative powdery mildew resistance protein, RPW8 [Helianthus debilis subsp. tardiflorus]
MKGIDEEIPQEMDPFSEPISKLSDAVIYVIKTTSNFKPQLRQLTNTLESITPIIVDIRNQNRKLDRTRAEQDMFVKDIEDARKLVEKCSTIKWNFIKRFIHSLKLKDLDQKLVRFFQIEVQAVQCRDIKEVLEEVKYVRERVTNLALEQTLSSGSMQMSSKREKICETSDRKKIGWPVPSLPRGIVGFEEPLKELKDKVLSDINIHDDGCGVGKVVVISAAGGCGKTTLVKMLCNDPQIQDNFGDNIFFVTVSETPDFMVTGRHVIGSRGSWSQTSSRVTGLTRLRVK